MTNIPVSERQNWIGASESAALFGVSPYATPFELWHQKAGNIPSPDLSDDERVMAGMFQEPAIAEWAAYKWKWPLNNVKEYRTHPSVQRMGCSLDFETVDKHEPTEIKNVDFSVFRDGDYIVEGDELVDAPAHFLIQVQHQLACPPPGHDPAERGWLVICVGGNKLYRMSVFRHERMINRIETGVVEFWRSIEAGIAPEPNFELDASTIALLYGGTGGEWADLRTGAVAPNIAGRAQALCKLYLDSHKAEVAMKNNKTAALAELKVMMKDARGALIDDGYRVKSSHIKESQSVRAEHWRFNVSQTTKD